MFFGYDKFDRVTVALLETSFDAVIHNARYTFYSVHSVKLR